MEFQNNRQRNVLQLVKCIPPLQCSVRTRVAVMYMVLLQAGKVERTDNFSHVLLQSLHLKKQECVKLRVPTSEKWIDAGCCMLYRLARGMEMST